MGLWTAGKGRFEQKSLSFRARDMMVMIHCQCLITCILMKVQWAWIVMHRVKVRMRGRWGLIRLWESLLLHVSMAIVEICISVIVSITGESCHTCLHNGRCWPFFTRWDLKCPAGRRSNCHSWFVYVHELLLRLLLLRCSAVLAEFLGVMRNVSERLLK